MGAGYDIGVSTSTSSGAQGGTINNGDFIIGGSGGANKWPLWVGIGAALVAVLVFFAFLLKK